MCCEQPLERSNDSNMRKRLCVSVQLCTQCCGAPFGTKSLRVAQVALGVISSPPMWLAPELAGEGAGRLPGVVGGVAGAGPPAVSAAPTAHSQGLRVTAHIFGFGSLGCSAQMGRTQG